MSKLPFLTACRAQSLLTPLVALGLIACDGKLASLTADPATCSSESTLTTLRQVMHRNGLTVATLGEQRAIDIALRALDSGAVKITTDAVRTVSRDDKLKSSSCKASLIVAVPAGTPALILTNGDILLGLSSGQWGATPDGLSFYRDIEYNTQMTDDGKSVYVELRDGQIVSSGVALLAVAGGLVLAKGAVPGAGTAAPGRPTASPGSDLCTSLDLRTEEGETECAERQFKAQDAAMGSALQAAMTRRNPAQQAMLTDAHSLWKVRRMQTCIDEPYGRGDRGHPAALASTTCMRDWAAERTRTLEATR